ncbi:dihydrolipoyl dehydrogenase [Mesomycoplasma hyorhinis]|uniref:dihydrolipoyl dehydrogenase n=1 Tax=Mesomycoplasma hyorhinis TaxID=2100 RepID=UPI001C04024B|nr:dihydrolipoyl dehydrogenase [Mesomycoplasma hyorhinis]
MFKFKFADIGEGLHEGVVGEIFVKEGDMVKEGDSLFSVETDKMTSEIPSPATGKVVKILMAQGDTIHVGQEIFHIDDGKGDSAEEAAPAPTTEEPKKEEPQEEGGASVVGEVKVSNELFDLSAFTKPKSTTTAENKPASALSRRAAMRERALAQQAEAKSKGTTYSGSVDEEFDVIVIGSGPGGYLAASEAGQNGLKTLIVEKEFWGGVCLNVGCIPTKAMLKSVEVLELVNHASDYGVIGHTVPFKLSWEKMHQRKRDVVAKLVGGVQGIVRAAKAKSEVGEAEFLASHVIRVNGKVYRGKNLIIATGSTDRRIDLPGFAQAYQSGKVITSKEAINLEKQPKSITIVGGGVIGVEFAQIFATAGTKVTILQNLPLILANFDSEISKQVSANLEKLGVKIVTNATTQRFENDEVVYTVDNQEHRIKSELTLVSVGRVPNTQGLKEVGLELGPRSELVADEFCKTNVEGVYAIGDVSGKSMLAHVAYRHAVVAVANIVGKKEKYSDKTVPACIYTNPEIASIGLTEEQAKAKGIDFIVGKASYGHIGKAIATNETQGFAKLLVDKEFGEIIGVHILGAVATDIISELVVAVDLETTVYEVADAIHPHPTYSEIVWEAARNAVAKLNRLKK